MITWKQSLPGFEWLIHQVWYLELEHDDKLDKWPRLIPNPRAHLLFTPRDQQYCYQNGHQPFIGRGSHLLTISDELLVLEDTPPLKRIGITFRPEGLYLLHQKSIGKINQCEWFDWLETLFDAKFQDSLWQCTSQPLLIDILLQHFAQLELKPKDKAFNMVQAITLGVEASQQQSFAPDKLIKGELNTDMEIEQLAQHCACSRRTLERAFKQVMGLSVKKYQQMMKLEHMILALYAQDQEFDWTSFSQRFGFYDQSHLIRELKKQLDCTPSGYLQQRDLTIDIYGDFE